MTNGHMEFTHAFVIAASFALPDLLKSIVASIVASAVHRAFPGLVRSKARR